MSNIVCWQYLAKKQKELNSNNYYPNPNNTGYTISKITYQAAKEFIIEYEWVGNMGTSKYCFGLTFNQYLAAVVCYGPLVAPTKYKKILGENIPYSTIQLCRGASTFWAPKWGPSKLISKSLRILNAEIGDLVVFAYADPLAGEIGTIYQACNAIYLGTTSPGGGKKYIINGHTYDPRKVHKKFGSRARGQLSKIDPDYYTTPITPKHRYIFIMGSKSFKLEILERLRPIICPYPKRPA